MKKMLIGFLAVFGTLEILDMIIHGVILMKTYEGMQNVWRVDMMNKMWVLHIVKIIGAFFFTYIFSKGYEGKGIMEGLRYGFYVGMMMSVSFALGSYATFSIPYPLAIQWFFYALAEYLIAGVVVASVFGKKKESAPQG
jgi:hypothetical protein